MCAVLFCFPGPAQLVLKDVGRNEDKLENCSVFLSWWWWFFKFPGDYQTQKNTNIFSCQIKIFYKIFSLHGVKEEGEDV